MKHLERIFSSTIIDNTPVQVVVTLLKFPLLLSEVRGHRRASEIEGLGRG